MTQKLPQIYTANHATLPNTDQGLYKNPDTDKQHNSTDLRQLLCHPVFCFFCTVSYNRMDAVHTDVQQMMVDVVDQDIGLDNV